MDGPGPSRSSGFPPRVVLATANADKAAEIAEIMGAVVLVPRPEWVPEVEETGSTLEENALLKARALLAATGEPSLADDTGLEVDALGGAPGVWSARYAGPNASYDDNVAKLLAELNQIESRAGGNLDRRARFRTVIALAFEGGDEVIAQGCVEGWICNEPRGAAGFGYDPVFVPEEGDGKTFAEMEASEKHALSHRGRALRALKDLLGA
ncbi:MAG: RdgB/HAM1 family non-canonical purine NTP pyrophosphatase [Actinobacteria bacterium]|nr:RdgB/HAM1 family non-canonical purine NTP pyrophosphatase [Actinomycetota bacterium]